MNSELKKIVDAALIVSKVEDTVAEEGVTCDTEFGSYDNGEFVLTAGDENGFHLAIRFLVQNDISELDLEGLEGEELAEAMSGSPSSIVLGVSLHFDANSVVGVMLGTDNGKWHAYLGQFEKDKPVNVGAVKFAKTLGIEKVLLPEDDDSRGNEIPSLGEALATIRVLARHFKATVSRDVAVTDARSETAKEAQTIQQRMLLN